MIVFVCGSFGETLSGEEATRAHRIGKKVCRVFGRNRPTIYFTPYSCSEATVATQIVLAMKCRPNAYADQHLLSDIFEPEQVEIAELSAWLRDNDDSVFVVSPDFVELRLPHIVEVLIPGYRGVTALAPLEGIRLDISRQCGRKI